jgi:signal transduction histidine kinase
LWGERPESRLKKVLAELGKQPASLLITAVLFGLVGGLVSLLFTHDLRELFISLSSTAIFITGLWLTARKPILQFLVAPFVAISPLLWHLLSGDGIARIIPSVLATTIWAFAVTIVAVAWPAAIGIAADERDFLEIRNRNSDSQLDWLAKKLDQTNMEIAKYIHATLQTRLMAHAMKLEQTRTTENDMDDLRALLGEPLAGFGLRDYSVGEGMEVLTSSWDQLVTIHLLIDAQVAQSDQSVEATVQVTREAIVNCVRHGLADEISIEISDFGSLRKISVSDNGIGPRTGNPGLGSKIFESLCLNHELSRLPAGGSAFQATLSLL